MVEPRPNGRGFMGGTARCAAADEDRRRSGEWTSAAGRHRRAQSRGTQRGLPQDGGDGTSSETAYIPRTSIDETNLTRRSVRRRQRACMAQFVEGDIDSDGVGQDGAMPVRDAPSFLPHAWPPSAPNTDANDRNMATIMLNVRVAIAFDRHHHQRTRKKKKHRRHHSAESVLLEQGDSTGIPNANRDPVCKVATENTGPADRDRTHCQKASAKGGGSSIEPNRVDVRATARGSAAQKRANAGNCLVA